MPQSQSKIEMTPLERLENAVEAMILSSERAGQKQVKALEGLEPVIEALIASYTKGAKQIEGSVSSIKNQIEKLSSVITTSQDGTKQERAIEKLRKESIGLLEKLNKNFQIKPTINIPKPEVIQESKETVRLLKDLIEAVELKPLEVNLSNDFTVIEKALGRIEKLIKFEIPLDNGRVAVKLSDKDLERLTKSQSQAWQTVVTNSKLSNIASQEINPATEDTLALLLAQLQAINSNTDTLELKAENVNLNTDTLESKLDTLITQTDLLEQYLDTVETKLQAIADNSDSLEANTDQLEAKLDTLITQTAITTANVVPVTTGGLTAYHLVSGASTNATVVKASAGQLYGWYIYNSNASARKLAFHNTASTPTAGASVFLSVTIPGGSAANVEFTNGIAFSSGISITTVTGLADTDNTGVAANDLLINLFYK